ncbi:hypothetical protein D3C86_1206400 [compost metagenome]
MGALALGAHGQGLRRSRRHDEADLAFALGAKLPARKPGARGCDRAFQARGRRGGQEVGVEATRWRLARHPVDRGQAREAHPQGVGRGVVAGARQGRGRGLVARFGFRRGHLQRQHLDLQEPVALHLAIRGHEPNRARPSHRDPQHALAILGHEDARDQVRCVIEGLRRHIERPCDGDLEESDVRLILVQAPRGSRARDGNRHELVI